MSNDDHEGIFGDHKLIQSNKTQRRRKATKASVARNIDKKINSWILGDDGVGEGSEAEGRRWGSERVRALNDVEVVKWE